MENIKITRIPHNTLTRFSIAREENDVVVFEINGLRYKSRVIESAARAEQYLLTCLKEGEHNVAHVLMTLEDIGLRRVV